MDETVNKYLRNCPEEIQRHCQRTGVLMVALLKQIHQSSQPAEICLNGCSPYFYHDIGKCIVPGEILKKSTGLDFGEWKIMKQHTSFGGIIFDQLSELAKNPKEKAFCRIGSVVCRYHHERWDGKGYPFGLKGSAIPFLARVCAVADSWDAMVNNRCYRNSLAESKAIDEIKKGMGTQFDPEIAAAFLEIKKIGVHREA